MKVVKDDFDYRCLDFDDDIKYNEQRGFFGIPSKCNTRMYPANQGHYDRYKIEIDYPPVEGDDDLTMYKIFFDVESNYIAVKFIDGMNALQKKIFETTDEFKQWWLEMYPGFKFVNLGNNIIMSLNLDDLEAVR